MIKLSNLFTRNWSSKNIMWLAVTVGVVLFCAAVFVGVSSTGRQRWAEREFMMIVPPPGAKPTYSPFDSSDRAQFVGNSYSGSFSLDQVRDYYDSELAQKGWKFRGEENAIYGWPPNRELSGRIRYYSKQGYIAYLKYPGPNEARDSQLTFSFYIEFGWFESFAWKLQSWLGIVSAQTSMMSITDKSIDHAQAS